MPGVARLVTAGDADAVEQTVRDSFSQSVDVRVLTWSQLVTSRGLTYNMFTVIPYCLVSYHLQLPVELSAKMLVTNILEFV